MSLYNDVSAQTLMYLGIAAAVVFIGIVFRLCYDIRVLRRGHKDQVTRLRGSLMLNMLDRLNIPLQRYFRRTSDLDRERHIRVCETCTTPEECERMLLGEDIDPETFCPNYRDLKQLKKN